MAWRGSALQKFVNIQLREVEHVCVIYWVSLATFTLTEAEEEQPLVFKKQNK